MDDLEAQALDAQRYQFLRNVFAIDSADDEAEFAKLARLTGSEFDAAIDKAISDYAARKV